MRMSPIKIILFMGLFLVLLSCESGDNGGMTDGDEEMDGDEDLMVDGDPVMDGDDSSDGDLTVDGDPDVESMEDGDATEGETEEEAAAGIFDNPHDGRLYAAAGYAIITPNETNHPCTLLLGGTSTNRRAEGVHDDLEARAIVLQQDGRHAVLVSLDLVGWEMPDVLKVMVALEAYGVNRDRVVISSTHTHAAPDTIGVWGEEWNISGRCPEYADYLADTISGMIIALTDQMVPVSVYAAETVVNEPTSNYPNLMRDTRRPYVTNDHLNVARLADDADNTVATMVNWHCHPETMISSKEYSADFPRWTRKRMDETLGGTSVYFSGTVGGLMTNLGVHVPEYNEAGEPVMMPVDGDVEGSEGSVRALVYDTGEKQNWSMGYILADYAIAILADAPKMEGDLFIDTEYIEMPFENLEFYVAHQLGVIPTYEDFIQDNPEFCGPYGCLPQKLHHLQIGKLHMITLPGELFPEHSVGREEEIYDWTNDEEEWGPFTYEAIEGYRSSLPEGHLLMEFGLTNNELGYILPEGDYHVGAHPNYYEEYFSISRKTGGIVRNAIKALLERSAE